MKSYDLKTRIIFLFLGLMILFYIGYQVSRVGNKEFLTETAEYETVSDTIRTEGFAIRDELTIPLVTDGVLVYNYGDGDKVSSSSVLAEVYTTPEAAQNKQRAEEVAAELENLQKIQEVVTASHSNIEILSSQINEKVGKLIDTTQSGVVENLSELKEDITFMLNKKQIALRKGDSFDKRITYLTNQLEYLQESSGEAEKSLKTPAEGYFCQMVDGYENIYTPDKLADMDVETFKNIMAIDASRQGEYVGKIIKNQNWYFVVSVKGKELEKFNTYTSAVLDFGLGSGETMDAQIYRIIGEENDEEAIIIFKCKNINEGLLSIRKQAVDITFRTYSGLKVSREALCYEQSVIGVYVLERDAIIRFKPISIIRDQGSYVLCVGIGEDSNCLMRFDEVVINGGDLQDGQKVK